ncbi:MAG: hypothetical protein ACYTG7_14030 [Planctomycetota bacterium]|jgi:parallel beta-helix repeat protein
MRYAIIVFVLLLAVPLSGISATISVPHDYSTIQEAIDAAVNGDTVLVEPGTYVENIDFFGKAILVQSSQGASVTIIDGGNPSNPDHGSCVKFQSGEGSGSVLEGFTLTNGTGTIHELQGYFYYLGGGIFCTGSSPTIRDCELLANRADQGGGMCNHLSASPIVRNCAFIYNLATLTSGGGMCNSSSSSPEVTDCTFFSNGGNEYGGGISNIESSPTVTGCAFTDNFVSLYYGGGMYNEAASPAVMNCTFTGNTAFWRGGGMYNEDSPATITGCIFSENFAWTSGGSMYNDNSPLIVTACFFAGNTSRFGGGIYNYQSSTTLTDCTFSGNSANENGGGMFIYSFPSPTLNNCTFSNNSAVEDGGGIFNNWHVSAEFNLCTFSGNWAGEDGGGIFNRSDCSPTLNHCTFIANSSESHGGGMYNQDDCSPDLTDCLFSGNSTKCGGGMYNIEDSSPTMLRCIFFGNSASLSGGGMENLDHSSPLMINCTLCGNTADSCGGMYSRLSSPTLLNCTFFGNKAIEGSSGGIFIWEGSPTLTNCILWGDTPDEINVHDSTPDITFCDIQGGYPGGGNMDVDPLFADPAYYDCHLTYNSPCRNTGDNSAVTVLEDFEGDPRIAYGKVDMGADEFYPHLYCTGNFTPGGSIKGKIVGLPGTSPVGLFLGSGVLDPPVPTAWGSFFLQAPWFLIPLVPIPGNGILVLPATIPATPAAPYDLPMQALIGLNPDSLSNYYWLTVQ